MQFQDLNSFFCDRVYFYSDVIFEMELLMNWDIIFEKDFKLAISGSLES